MKHLKGTAEYRLAHETKWLAGGFFGIVWAFRGDMDWNAEFFNLPRHNDATPCGWCPATSGGAMPWSDFRIHPMAAWMRNIYSSRQWLAANPVRHALLTLPGVSILTVTPDLMHIKYLGTDQFVLGSVLYLLCFVILNAGDHYEHN